jgi:hypothetical protein
VGVAPGGPQAVPLGGAGPGSERGRGGACSAARPAAEGGANKRPFLRPLPGPAAGRSPAGARTIPAWAGRGDRCHGDPARAAAAAAP